MKITDSKIIDVLGYVRHYFFTLLVIIFLLATAVEMIWQTVEDRYVSKVANEVITRAAANDPQSRVVALRDYLRANISWHGAEYDKRPFLRDSAAETLRSGEGYCGEVTRTFINMASAVGIRSQRINLVGQKLHVVAEAEIASGNTVIVDCQNPPQIADLEPLDKVIQRPEFDDYYTLNLRRLHLNWLVSRIKLEMGPLTYVTENPHLLKASFWFLLAWAMLVIKGLRSLVRIILRRRGWVHLASIADVPTAVKAARKEQQVEPENEPAPLPQEATLIRQK